MSRHQYASSIDLDDPTFVADPYPRYRALRSERPVWFDERWNMWILTRYQDVKSSFTDRRLVAGHVDMIAGTIANSGVGLERVADYLELLGGMITFKDRGDHARIRGMTAGALAKATANWPAIIERAARGLLDRISSTEEFDAVTDFARPLPLTVICDSCGIPESDREMYQGWAVDYAHFLGVPRPDGWERLALAGNAASIQLREYFKQLINQRKKRPGNDMISYFVLAFQDAGLGDDGLVSMCVNFANAGHFTVVDQLANAIYQLLGHREQLDRLARSPDRWLAAVDEAMRFDSNPQFTIRFVTEDLDIGGQRIAKGDTIAAGLAAANHDPEVFENPDQFDISLPRANHLTFGFGPGYCMGSELARQEMALGLRALFERFPGLSLSRRRSPIRRWDCLMFRGFEKRSKILTGDEICDASQRLYGDPDHLRIYGMTPREFTDRGVRLFGRTAVECTTDPHATAIAQAVSDQADELCLGQWSVVDLFAGSGNLLYHLAALTGADPALGFERDPAIFGLTRANLERRASRARLHSGAFQDCLRPELVPHDRACVVCLHPPWGDGFSFTDGLDLRKTDPPTPDILRAVRQCLPGYRLVFVHHIHEQTVEASVAAVTRGYQIHARGVTRGSPPGMNTGYVICSPAESL
jgi:cytochrome P450/predicted RNA methylase